MIENGILYKMAFGKDGYQILIYNLVSDQPIVSDIYEYYEALKS